MQPRIGSDQSLNIFYQTLTLEYRSTEPCSCYNKAIDEITLPGFEDLAKKAKYEEPVSAEAFAMQIVAAQKKTGQAFLNDREDDVDKSGVKDVTPTSNNGGQGEDNDPFGDIIDQMYPQTK